MEGRPGKQLKLVLVAITQGLRMMGRVRIALGLVAMLLAVCLSAAAETEPVKTLPDAPVANLDLGAGMGYVGEIGSLKKGVVPFSSLAVQVKVGLAGIGVDFATPVANKLNPRRRERLCLQSESGDRWREHHRRYSF